MDSQQRSEGPRSDPQVGVATRKRRWALVVALGWTAILLVMLWSPPPKSPRFDLPGLDKFIHGALFGGFVLAWAYADRRLWAIATAGVVLAIVTELVQGILPWPRMPDVWDACADGVGLALAFAWLRLRGAGRA